MAFPLAFFAGRDKVVVRSLASNPLLDEVADIVFFRLAAPDALVVIPFQDSPPDP